MATFQFNLVSPEKLLFSGDVDQVDVPGAEGDFGVLAGHAPLMATLRPAGVVTVYVGNRIQRFEVNGGFADVSLQGLTILANEASSRD
jgi:F-type H+-transporting ATPase subunit epsilon